MFAKLVKYVFIAFNLLMVVWLYSGISGGGEMVSDAASDAEAAGAVIGTGIGVFLIFVVWTIGDIILGITYLIARPSKS